MPRPDKTIAKGSVAALRCTHPLAPSRCRTFPLIRKLALAPGRSSSSRMPILKGVGRNNEHLYPSFPYTSYQRMSLDDVRDLYAFLKTVPPETTPSEPHPLPFPFNIPQEHRRSGSSSSSRASRSSPIPPETRVQSRRLPGRGARALRRMSQRSQYSRRHQTI